MVSTSLFLCIKKTPLISIPTGLLGIQFNASMNKKGSVFIQTTGCTVLTIDTAQIIATRQLPEVADVSSLSLGATYEFNNTNYKFNAVRGNEIYFIGSAGTKRLKKNSQIIQSQR